MVGLIFTNDLGLGFPPQRKDTDIFYMEQVKCHYEIVKLDLFGCFSSSTHSFVVSVPFLVSSVGKCIK